MRAVLCFAMLGCGGHSPPPSPPPPHAVPVIAMVPVDAAPADPMVEADADDADEPPWQPSCNTAGGEPFAHGTVAIEVCELSRHSLGRHTGFHEYQLHATLLFHPASGDEIRADLGDGGSGHEMTATTWTVLGTLASADHEALLIQRDNDVFAYELANDELRKTELVSGDIVEVEVAPDHSHATVTITACEQMGMACLPMESSPKQTFALRWKGDQVIQTAN